MFVNFENQTTILIGVSLETPVRSRLKNRRIQGCSGAGTRGNAVPIFFFVWERRSHRHFVPVGTAFPLPAFVFSKSPETR